ncbi:MAG: hypothetical protein PHF86_05700 [Candidatus Nanoarchaeia archaeon]|nr:hypothetical protein [Candidatus Nanoarchaeia archaeon]
MKISNQTPLVQIEVPKIGFLADEQFLEEYNRINQTEYGSNPYLNVLKFRDNIDNIIKGSNPFAIVLANQILSQEGLRVARQSDLEKLIKIDPNYLKGTYEDTGLVLRNKQDPDSYLAQDLIKQLKLRDRKLKLPIMIPLTELILQKDQNSIYGLSFKLKESADVIYSSILNEENSKFSSEDINEKTGLPNKLGNGNRNFYTRNSGLSGLFLYRGLDLNSYDVGLGYSNLDGRVVVVSGEATQKIKQ